MVFRSDEFTVQRDSLQFDLHGLHVESVRKRCIAALVAALEQQTFGPALGRLVATLTAQTKESPVRLFTNYSEWKPNSPPILSAQPAVCTWSRRSAHGLDTVDDCRNYRFDPRVWVNTNTGGDNFGLFLEVLWHELLHPTVPFTHHQEDWPIGKYDLPDGTHVDDSQWYPSMTALRNDMPLDVVDPLSGRSFNVRGEVWSKLDGCLCVRSSLA